MPNTPSLKCPRVYEALRRDGMSKAAAARISNGMYNRGHCGAKRKEAGDMSELYVTKDASGAHRWVLTSSSAYVDRDGEIVTEKALQKAVERMEATGEYGDLRWWHTPIVLGQADFAGVHAHHLIESGTFVNKAVAARVMAAADRLGASIGFRHPADEPKQGEYSDITIKERSLLPRGKESNLFTALAVTGGKMDETKKAQLVELVGADEAAGLIARLDNTAKEADEAGVTRKEQGLLSRLGAWLLGQPEVAQADAVKEADDSADESDDAEPEAQAQAAAPEAQAESADTGDTETKAADADPDSEVVTVATLKAAIAELRRELGGKSKETSDMQAELQTVKAAAALAAQAAEAASTEAAAAKAAAAALTSELPRGLAAVFRASKSESTVTKEAEAQAKKAAQTNDPFDAYLTERLGLGG